MRTLMLVVGNGLTIDLLHKLDMTQTIDTQCLFRKGDIVPWPDGSNEVGFLSYKHCRCLWNLGARPFMNKDEANLLIEDILSCANMMPMTGAAYFDPNNIYINAYFELVAYLKQLFVHYDKLVPASLFRSKNITSWGWYRLIKSAYTNTAFDKIVIITYNYDVFLERILTAKRIPFSVLPIESDRTKISIIKPHGSISFTHNIENDKSLFAIRKGPDLEASINEFKIKYDKLDGNYIVNALIPPAGDSSRLTFKWASQLRSEALTAASKLKKDDLLILSGLSYWHVDRKELDEVITSVSKDVHTFLVNPNPPRALNAVLSCRFENYIAYTNSDIIGGLVNG